MLVGTHGVVVTQNWHSAFLNFIPLTSAHRCSLIISYSRDPRYPQAVQGEPNTGDHCHHPHWVSAVLTCPAWSWGAASPPGHGAPLPMGACSGAGCTAAGVSGAGCTPDPVGCGLGAGGGGIPAIAEQPASEGAVRGQLLHDACCQQAHHHLHPHHRLHGDGFRGCTATALPGAPLCWGSSQQQRGRGTTQAGMQPCARTTHFRADRATSRMQPMHLWPCPRANLDVQPVPVHSPGQPPEHASTVQHLRPRTPPAQARLCTHPHWSTLSMRPPKRNPSGQPSHTPLSTPSPGAHLPRTAAHGPQASHPLPALTMPGSAQRRPQEARPPPPLPAGQSDAVFLLIGSSLANGEADPRGGGPSAGGPFRGRCLLGAVVRPRRVRLCGARARVCIVRVCASCVRPVCCTYAQRAALRCPCSPTVGVLGVQRRARLWELQLLLHEFPV